MRDTESHRETATRGAQWIYRGGRETDREKQPGGERYHGGGRR